MTQPTISPTHRDFAGRNETIVTDGKPGDKAVITQSLPTLRNGEIHNQLDLTTQDGRMVLTFEGYKGRHMASLHLYDRNGKELQTVNTDYAGMVDGKLDASWAAIASVTNDPYHYDPVANHPIAEGEAEGRINTALRDWAAKPANKDLLAGLLKMNPVINEYNHTPIGLAQVLGLQAQR